MVNRNPLDSFNMSMSQADFEQGEECENSICAQNFQRLNKIVQEQAKRVHYLETKLRRLQYNTNHFQEEKSEMQQVIFH